MRVETMADCDATSNLLRTIEGMSRVVSQLLDAAELETLVIDPGEMVDLRHVCAEVAELMAPLAVAQGRTLALTGAERSVLINGNAEMLSRAIRNLVENALTHTPLGTDVEIIVGESGSVHVLDRGKGVPFERRDKIFDRFWRRDLFGSSGAGLGLSIVKRIVDAHGGIVTVDDRPGGGADFSMNFVLANQPKSQHCS